LAATTGTDVPTHTRERPGMSAFALEDGIVNHTYSACARGLDALWGMYQWLDRAPRGRNETRREDDPFNFYRRHDEYDGDWRQAREGLGLRTPVQKGDLERQ
jgi:predicted dithiol-disulfide oxidoreductase (DUF899 family)